MYRVRVLVAICLWGALFIASSVANATLINGDFSAGFTGWKGEVTDVSLNTITNIDPLPGSFTDNFDATLGAAVLTTSTLANDIFSVFIFQEFVVDPVSPDERLILSYDLSASLTNEALGDTAFAQLNHGPSFTQTIDLFAFDNVDITFLANQSVELLFGVEDFDDIEDSLTVDNVAITRVSVQVPEPETLSMLVIGLIGLASFRNQFSRRLGERSFF